MKCAKKFNLNLNLNFAIIFFKPASLALLIDVVDLSGHETSAV